METLEQAFYRIIGPHLANAPAKTAALTKELLAAVDVDRSEPTEPDEPYQWTESEAWDASGCSEL